MAGAEKATLPERRMLLLDRRKTTVDARDVRASLAVGHRQVLERAVDLLLSILEPTRDVGLLLSQRLVKLILRDRAVFKQDVADADAFGRRN